MLSVKTTLAKSRVGNVTKCTISVQGFIILKPICQISIFGGKIGRIELMYIFLKMNRYDSFTEIVPFVTFPARDYASVVSMDSPSSR